MALVTSGVTKDVQVLIVDDETPFREAADAVLGVMTDFTVVGTVETGDEEGLALARSPRPDLVVLDVNLPGMSGVGVSLLLTEEQPTALVVLVSTYDESEFGTEVSRCGAAGYLRKSDFGADRLLELLDNEAGEASSSRTVHSVCSCTRLKDMDPPGPRPARPKDGHGRPAGPRCCPRASAPSRRQPRSGTPAPVRGSEHLIAEAAPTPILLIVDGSLPGELVANARYAEAGPSATLWRLPAVSHTKGIVEVADQYERRVVEHFDVAFLDAPREPGTHATGGRP